MAEHQEMATVSNHSNHKRRNLEVSNENVTCTRCTYRNSKPRPFELDRHPEGDTLDGVPSSSLGLLHLPDWFPLIEGTREKTNEKVATLELKQPTKLSPQAKQTHHGMYGDAPGKNHCCAATGAPTVAVAV